MAESNNTIEVVAGPSNRSPENDNIERTTGKDEEEDDNLQEASKPLLGSASSLSDPKEVALRQIFLGIIVSLPSLPVGMSFAFSAIALDQLSLTISEASWFASVTALAFPLGALLVGPLMDKYGRRPALLSINVVNFAGWLFLSFYSRSPSFERLIIGRVLNGLAGGLASIPAAVYSAECLCSAGDRFRSTLVAWSIVSLCTGIFLVFLLGAFFIYTTVAAVAAAITILSFILIVLFLAESPIWLKLQGRHGDSELAQKRLGIVAKTSGTSSQDPENAGSQSPPPAPPPSVNLNNWRELTKPQAYKPLFIMVTFFFFQQFSGVYVVIAYMLDVIRAAGIITINAYLVAVISGSIILIVSILASFLYPKTGVRSVAIVSGAGTCITMMIIAGFEATRLHWVTRQTYYLLHWFPFFAFLSNVALSTAGFLILPWSMLGEVFPMNVKGLAAGLATFTGFIFKFIAVKLFPAMERTLGTSSIFFLFGGMAFLGTIFIIFFLPETKGKTLQQIVDDFAGKNKSSNRQVTNIDQTGSSEA